MKDLIISLDTKSNKYLYEQIYEHIQNEIIVGKLRRGEQLPSTRLLSTQLQIARTTVDQAYEQLMAEGYIESKPYKGYYVSDIKQLQQLENVQENEAKFGDNQEKADEKVEFDFSPNGMDMSYFPFDTWKRIHKQVLLDKQESVLQMGDSKGDLQLRQTIRRYLHSYRGVDCEPGQVVIGAGNDYLLLLLQKILGEHRHIAMENATYMRAYRIFNHAGYKVNVIQSDESGVCMQELHESDSTLVYTMPTHQYPLGITMPIKRRMELLDWACQKEERYIIEDDYDSEFRYKGKPIPALQSFDKNGKVIYIGTFSKSIAPAIRVSYMVLPQKLMHRFDETCSYLSSTVSRIDQAVLNEFIANGHFERYLNKMRKIYRQKRDLMLELLEPFRTRFDIRGEDAGLHMVLKLKSNDPSEVDDLLQKARACNCKVYSVSDSLIEAEEVNMILLGYGGFEEKKLREGIERLKKAWL